MSFRLSACRGVLASRLQPSRCSPADLKLQSLNRLSSRLFATSKDRSEERNHAEGESAFAPAHKVSADVAPEQELTGSAKLLAEALVEEETVKAKEHWRDLSEKEAANTP